MRERPTELPQHSRNCRIYAAALQTTDRGPDFQLGLADSIAKEASQVTLPSEIKGPPPYKWRSSDMTFKVLSVGPIAVGGKIYVMIRDESPPWSSDAQINGCNKKLIAYFKERSEEGTHRALVRWKRGLPQQNKLERAIYDVLNGKVCHRDLPHAVFRGGAGSK